MGIMSNAKEHLRTLRDLTRSRMEVGRLQSAVAETRDRFVDVEALRHEVAELRNTMTMMDEGFERREAALMKDVAGLHRVIEIQRQSYVDITRQLSSSVAKSAPAVKKDKAAAAASTALPADPFEDVFYREFEDRYRGSREEILERLRSAYAPHIGFLHDVDTAKYPAVDIGCGRGEWLEILQEEGITAIGVDNNERQAEDAREMGMTVEIADALDWLKARRARSVSFLSMMHIIEHMEFSMLVQVLKEAMRVLKPGGKLLLETPNPESLIVGAYKFWMDPTHVRPYPPEVISRLLESLSFSQIDVLRLHPDGRNRDFRAEHNLAGPIADLLVGPLDYAIICQRG